MVECDNVVECDNLVEYDNVVECDNENKKNLGECPGFFLSDELLDPYCISILRVTVSVPDWMRTRYKPRERPEVL